MSEWRDEDEVTTTYGTIQLAQMQAYEAGMKAGKEKTLSLIKLERDKGLAYYEDGLVYAAEIIEREING
jgi:hypothetical protein